MSLINVKQDFDSIADVIDQAYKGEVVQIYCSDDGGITRYSDYNIDQKIFFEGRVLWGRGMVVALECEVEVGEKVYKKEILVNGWGITSVIKKDDDGINISSLLKGTLIN